MYCVVGVRVEVNMRLDSADTTATVICAAYDEDITAPTNKDDMNMFGMKNQKFILTSDRRVAKYAAYFKPWLALGQQKNDPIL